LDVALGLREPVVGRVAQTGSFTLAELVHSGQAGHIRTAEGATLRYCPQRQRIGAAPLIEVCWPEAPGGPCYGLIEVAPDGFGGLLARPAETADDETTGGFRLPLVPLAGWSREASLNRSR
jgi:hypothetical protein